MYSQIMSHHYEDQKVYILLNLNLQIVQNIIFDYVDTV